MLWQFFDHILFFLARWFNAPWTFDLLFALNICIGYFNVEVHVESLALFVELVVEPSLSGLPIRWLNLLLRRSWFSFPRRLSLFNWRLLIHEFLEILRFSKVHIIRPNHHSWFSMATTSAMSFPTAHPLFLLCWWLGLKFECRIRWQKVRIMTNFELGCEEVFFIKARFPNHSNIWIWRLDLRQLLISRLVLIRTLFLILKNWLFHKLLSLLIEIHAFVQLLHPRFLIISLNWFILRHIQRHVSASFILFVFLKPVTVLQHRVVMGS